MTSSIPGPTGLEITLPIAGDIREEDGKKFIWTVKIEGTVTTGEWVEETPVRNYGINFDMSDYC
jgi:hypothetical protein